MLYYKMKISATAGNGYSRMLWCGYQQAAMSQKWPHVLMMVPVPPMLTKVSGKCLFEAAGFCPVWFNFVISNQIKGLRGVFPVRNVGQTSHICVSTSQHGMLIGSLFFFLFNLLYPQSDWMSNGRGGQGIEGFTCFCTRTSLRGAGVHKAGFGTCAVVSSSLDEACLLLGTWNCFQM